MHRTIWTAALVVGFSLAAGAQEAVPEGFVLLYDPAYEIPAGVEGLQKLEMTMSSENLVLTMGEVKLNGSMKNTAHEVVAGKHLAADRFRYRQKEAVSKSVFTFGGQEQVAPAEDEPLLNVPVLLEKEGGKWKARLEEGEPNEAQIEELQELEEEWNDEIDADLYGKRPRRIGERWEIDAGLLPSFRDAADEVRGKIELTLKEVKEVEGQRCAAIEGTIDALMVMKGEGEEPDTKLGLKGTLRILRSLKYFEDLAVEMKGELKLTADGPGPNGPMKIEGTGPFVFTGSLELK